MTERFWKYIFFFRPGHVLAVPKFKETLVPMRQTSMKLVHHLARVFFCLEFVTLTMPSKVDVAKRALVSVLRALAAAYGIILEISRDSADEQLRSSYRKLSRRAHPDRGGNTTDQQQLNDAYSTWDTCFNFPAPPTGVEMAIFQFSRSCALCTGENTWDCRTRGTKVP